MASTAVREKNPPSEEPSTFRLIHIAALSISLLSLPQKDIISMMKKTNLYDFRLKYFSSSDKILNLINQVLFVLDICVLLRFSL